MIDQIQKYAAHIESLTGVPCSVFDVTLKELGSGHFCAGCPARCDFINTHLYGCWEAHRWGGKYIYYCPAGFIFVAAAVANETGMLQSGVLAGPIVMGNAEDFDAPFAADGIINLTTTQVNDLAELMGGLFPTLADKGGYGLSTEHNTLLNDIYKVIDEIKYKETAFYPLELEKELQTAIISGNKGRAKELLNTLLGYIFFSSNADLATIKSRVAELLVLLGRSAIEGGAEANQIFSMNADFSKEIGRFDSLESLSVWLTGIINRYISDVFEFAEAKHTDVMHKVTAYIKAHYSEKLSLSDIAEHVYLSKSYLSKIFKEEMHCSLTDYINSIRIEKSKLLMLDPKLSLVEVAAVAGFDNQSYFTKVFRKVTGVSPGKYRETRGVKTHSVYIKNLSAK